MVLRRECRENGETCCDFATYDVNVSDSHPDMRGEAFEIVRRGAVIKHRWHAASPQHEVCSKALFEAHRAQRNPTRTGKNCPTNASRWRSPRLIWSFPPTNRPRRQPSNVTKRKRNNDHSGKCQTKQGVDQQQAIIRQQQKKSPYEIDRSVYHGTSCAPVRTRLNQRLGM